MEKTQIVEKEVNQYHGLFVFTFKASLSVELLKQVFSKLKFERKLIDNLNYESKIFKVAKTNRI